MTPTEDDVRLVRHFQENSIKFLMRNSTNACEGLTLMAPKHAPLLDFSQMTVMPTTFIAPDFRHLETDLLLRAPMRGKRGQGQVYVYQLIEHQTDPDEHATFRCVRYQGGRRSPGRPASGVRTTAACAGCGSTRCCR